MAKKLENEKIREIIRENLTHLRLKKGLTQGDVAAAVDKSASGVASWEQGLSLPDPAVLYRLSKLYNVDMNYFYESHVEGIKPVYDDYPSIQKQAIMHENMHEMIREMIKEELSAQTKTGTHIIPVEVKVAEPDIKMSKPRLLKIRRGENGKYSIIRESKHTGTGD